SLLHLFTALVTMSTGARGKSASQGLDDEVLVPLLARLTTLKNILASAGGTSNSESRALLEKIQQEMAQLKSIVGRIDDTEKEIRYSFDPVERHINDALRDVAEVNWIHPKLRAVEAEMKAIRVKMHEAYNIASDCQQEREDGRAPSPQASASSLTVEGTKIWKSPQMRHIRLVVGWLEERLRGCLLCLVAFPGEGATGIKKRTLVHWWIGEGFVESPEEGNIRFKELVDKGFITPLPKVHCHEIHRCKLLPWLRDLLRDIAKSNFFLDVDLNMSRRAFLSSRKTMSPIKFSPKVRTIFNISQKYVQLGEGWFAGKELRTLQLGQWRESTPSDQIADPNQSHVEVSGTERFEELDKCCKLRYVSFRGISRIETLPRSIRKLRELVVLHLRACHDLEKLRQGITKLDRLEYLDLSECHLLIGMPKGIGRLTRLEVLKGFVIANFNCKDPCRLDELTKLSRLKKLSITISKMAAPAADEFKKLGELKALKSLAIVWGVQSSAVGQESPSPFTIAKMEFALPPGLEKLDLRGFPQPNFERWVRPKHVKKLYIRGGKLSTLGDDEDWEVEVLHLRFLKDLHYDLDRLGRSFRKLTSYFLLIHECPNFRT
uniref:Disease resistance R13L4/SHOC-2-like LRR domain-containing protein n=2 Tax=Aegilops tauschii TaxID=37682 RepID=A0A453Q6N7_AEGTS